MEKININSLIQEEMAMFYIYSQILVLKISSSFFQFPEQDGCLYPTKRAI